MIPIYEQGSGCGIGHNLESFRDRFDVICEEHLANSRARRFAFIFYDFTNHDLRKILKDQGAFARLDRLSGSELSIFYLHSGVRKTVEEFNSHFLNTLGISESVTLPCVVFFLVNGKEVEDIAVAQLDNTDLIHGFQELYETIERDLNAKLETRPKKSRALKWLQGGTRFVGLELFRAALKRGFDFF